MWEICIHVYMYIASLGRYDMMQERWNASAHNKAGSIPKFVDLIPSWLTFDLDHTRLNSVHFLTLMLISSNFDYFLYKTQRKKESLTASWHSYMLILLGMTISDCENTARLGFKVLKNLFNKLTDSLIHLQKRGQLNIFSIHFEFEDAVTVELVHFGTY